MFLNLEELARLKSIKKTIEGEDPEEENVKISNHSVLWLVNKLLKAQRELDRLNARMFITTDEKDRLERAKLRLMHTYNLTEAKAYCFIRDMAMSQRISRDDIAKRILDAKEL